MSGGRFDYIQFRLNDVGAEIEGYPEKYGEQKLDEFGYAMNPVYCENTLQVFKEAARFIELASILINRIDWLVSGDDGEESFHERLSKDFLNMRNK